MISRLLKPLGLRTRPKSVAIMGERNSGTNFLRQALKKNTDLKVRNGYRDSWKHGFLREEKISPEYLFVFIFKDPFSYILSLYRRPHEINYRCVSKCNLCDQCSEHERLTLGRFIRHEYYSIRGRTTGQLPGTNSVGEEVLSERNFNLASRPRYPNALQMLSDKYRNWMAVAELTSNVLYVSFEDLIADPQVTLTRINERLTGKPVVGYSPITRHTKKDQVFDPSYYLEKRYMDEFEGADREFIMANFTFPYENFLERTRMTA